MAFEDHYNKLKGDKKGPRMKVLLSALLIMLSGVTAVVAQQTALANLEDDSNSAAKNNQELKDDRVLRHKDPPQLHNNDTTNTNLEHEPGIFYSVYIKFDGFMVLVVVNNADNLNRDPIFRADTSTKFDGPIFDVHGVLWDLNWAELRQSACTTDGSSDIATSVCKGKYVPDGRNDGKVLSLKNVQIVSIRVVNLVNGPMEEVPVFYMPHYTDFNGVMVIASQQHTTFGTQSVESNVDEYISHSNDTGGSGDIDVPDIPPSFGGGCPTITIIILVLNWDHDGDGDSILDDIVNWVVNLFKGDEGGDDEEDDEGGDDDTGSGEGDGFKDPGNGNPPWGPLY